MSLTNGRGPRSADHAGRFVPPVVHGMPGFGETQATVAADLSL